MSDTIYGDVKYFCDICKKTRVLKILKDNHEELITQSPNGLVSYSDVHICAFGISGVNNLQIDKNFHVRSFDALKLPKYEPTTSKIPKPGLPKLNNTNVLHLYELPVLPDLQLVIEFNFLNSKLLIGKRKVSEEPPISLILSDFTGISIKLYKKPLEGSHIEDWLKHLANSLELIPATKLGLIIESLNYIADIHDNKPTDFDILFIRTILTSHEVYFLLDDVSELMNLPSKYPKTFDTENMKIMENFIATLMENPLLSLQDFNETVQKDLVFIIYLLLLLEKEQVITIERAGIVEY